MNWTALVRKMIFGCLMVTAVARAGERQILIPVQDCGSGEGDDFSLVPKTVLVEYVDDEPPLKPGQMCLNKNRPDEQLNTTIGQSKFQNFLALKHRGIHEHGKLSNVTLLHESVQKQDADDVRGLLEINRHQYPEYPFLVGEKPTAITLHHRDVDRCAFVNAKINGSGGSYVNHTALSLALNGQKPECAKALLEGAGNLIDFSAGPSVEFVMDWCIKRKEDSSLQDIARDVVKACVQHAYKISGMTIKQGSAQIEPRNTLEVVCASRLEGNPLQVFATHFPSLLYELLESSVILQSYVPQTVRPGTCPALVSIAGEQNEVSQLWHNNYTLPLLLQLKANVNEPYHVDALQKRHDTALHVAAAAGNAGAVRLLLAHGADISIKDIAGATALMCARGEAEKVLKKASWWRSVWRMAGFSGVVLAISALAYYFHEYGELPAWTETMMASLKDVVASVKETVKQGQ